MYCRLWIDEEKNADHADKATRRSRLTASCCRSRFGVAKKYCPSFYATTKRLRQQVANVSERQRLVAAGGERHGVTQARSKPKGLATKPASAWSAVFFQIMQEANPIHFIRRSQIPKLFHARTPIPRTPPASKNPRIIHTKD